METGNVKQVAAFEKLVSFCNAHGATYNPSKASLKVAALNTLLTSAQQSLEAVKTADTAFANAVNARNQAFDALPKFMTRVINILAATDASADTVKEAYFYARRLRPVKKLKQNPPATGVQETASRSRSNSQLDFDGKADNFAAFVKVVAGESSYKPNEADLTTVALTKVVTNLRSLNTAVITAQVALSNARIARDKALYQNGIYGTAKASKHYIKGVFGFQSADFKQVSALTFVNRKTQ
jgi:hypothetical protein